MNLPTGTGPSATGKGSRSAGLCHLLRTGASGVGVLGMQDHLCPLDGSNALQPGQPPQTLEAGRRLASFPSRQDLWDWQL